MIRVSIILMRHQVGRKTGGSEPACLCSRVEIVPDIEWYFPHIAGPVHVIKLGISGKVYSLGIEIFPFRIISFSVYIGA